MKRELSYANKHAASYGLSKLQGIDEGTGAMHYRQRGTNLLSESIRGRGRVVVGGGGGGGVGAGGGEGVRTGDSGGVFIGDPGGVKGKVVRETRREEGVAGGTDDGRGTWGRGGVLGEGGEGVDGGGGGVPEEGGGGVDGGA